MTSKIYRTAGSIKNGTVAAASYAGSTLAYVAPQMAGAIDIMVVSQPDGSLRSSPFYVRFGKYTGLRTADKKVHLVVNDVEADFTMHLGRSGEAYFVGEDDVAGDSDEEGELLAGIMSPHTGYSSADEALSYATPQQTASIQAAVAKLGHSPGFHIQAAADKQAASSTPSLRPAHSSSTVTDILSVPAALDTSLSAPPGDPTLRPPPKHPPSSKSRFQDMPPSPKGGSSSKPPLIPPGLGSPTTPKHPSRMGSRPSQSGLPPFQQGQQQGSHDVGEGWWAGEGSPASPQPVCSHLTVEIMQQEEERRASNAQAETSSSPPGRPAVAHHPPSSLKGSSSRAAHQQKATAGPLTPFELASQEFLEEHRQAKREPSIGGPSDAHSDDRVSTPLISGKSGNPVAAPQSNGRRGSAEVSQHDGQEPEPIGGSSSEADERLIHILQAAKSKEATSNGDSPQDFAFHLSSEASSPTHPWSVAKPRYLGTPTASQPPTLTMHASAAAAPVGPGSASASAIAPAQPMAMTQPSPEANTAIPAVMPIPGGSEDGSKDGNRIELEALYEEVHDKQQTAQMAMLTAHKERVEWDHEGGLPPLHSHFGLEAAVGGDLAAAEAAHLSSGSLHSSSCSPHGDHDSCDSQQNPCLGHHVSDPTAHPPADPSIDSLAHQLCGDPPRTPLSPQPSRPPQPVLTRQFSKSAPSSPRYHPPVSFAPPKHPSDTPPDTPQESTAQAPCNLTESARGGDANQEGAVQIPSRARQQGVQGSQQTGALVGGSEGGSIGPLHGVSPPDGYMADSELAASRHRLHHSSVSLSDSGRLLGAGSSGGGIAADPWAGLAGFEVSLCGDHLSPAMSPEEVYQAFQAHRVSEGQFAEQGPVLVSRPSLMCRLGDRILPWPQAAPVVMGVLAFGGDWQRLLLPEQGVPIAVPLQQFQGPQPGPGKAQVAKSSSWRVWLGSWRSGGSTGRTGKSGSGGMDAAVAAAAAAAHPRSPAAQQLALEALGSELSPGAASMVSELVASQQGRPLPLPGRRRAFVPSHAQLKALPLQYGQNTIDFTFAGQRLRAYIHYFNWNSRLVISDIDGTITKSDLLGHLLPRVGFDWSHRGVTRLFTNIKANGYVFMFLSSRAIAQASATRDYLHSLNQDGETLPAGPVIISPDGLFPSLYRELVLRRPHEFKIRCLEDIRALFPSDWNPFYAGFGNRDTDEISYLTVGVPASKCFIINPKGELRKASSAVATSTWGSLTSVNTIVQAMFPPVPQEAPHATPEREEFNDYNYWHVTPPIIIDSEDDAFGDPEGQQYDSDSSESDSDEDSYHHFL